MCKVSN